MQCEFSNEWDYIQNSISDLTNKLELLPEDLKDKAVKLLQEKLSVDDSTLPTNIQIKKPRRVSGRIIKKTKRRNDFITEESNENVFTDESLHFNNGNLDIKLEITEQDDIEEIPILYSQTQELTEIICDICAFVGSNANEMKKHKRLAHGIIQERICHTCGKVLPSFRQLQAHMAGHLQELELENRQDAQKFECEICGNKLGSKWTYMEHIGRHFNRQRKTCDICGKLFTNSSQLNAHKRVHEPPKLPCFVCNKKFRNKHKLAIHFLIHSGQRDFACPECPYKTYLKHNLQKHCLRQHNINYPPVRQAIKRLNPDDFETSMLNDPVARSHISKIRIKGECYPLNVTSEINKKIKEEPFKSEYDLTELIIANEVEINDDGIIMPKQRKRKPYSISKVEKVKKEKLVKHKDKIPKVIKDKTSKSIKKMNKHLTSDLKVENDIVVLEYNNWNTVDVGNSQIFHFNPDTTIDCVEETIYA